MFNNTLLHRVISEQAFRRPEAVAVRLGQDVLSYAVLERKSGQIAAALKGAGCRPGDRVALMAPVSPTAVAAMLGALKAGCVYVPLDRESPPARLARIVQSCAPKLVLTSQVTAGAVTQLLTQVKEAGGAPLPELGWLDPQPPPETLGVRFRHADLETLPAEGPEATFDAPDSHPVHILFTSGSTGVPKGVVITHANILGFIRWANGYFQTQPEDRISGHTPLHFDLSTYDVYGTLAAGAELVQVPAAAKLLPNKMAEFIRAEKLTRWFSVPSVLSLMARMEVVEPNDFPSLRQVIWCGEVFPTPMLMHWMQRVPHATYTNLYGPTEATIASSYYRVERCPEDPRQPIPIGYPCGGEELLVLDAELRPVPEGEQGEICIAGVGLSPGYWQDEAKTAAAFVHLPDGRRLYRTGDLGRKGPDGAFHFIGRADTQVKSRGYRIELGEIEAALGTLDALSEAAVVALDTGGFEGATLCCAYASKSDSLETAAVREALAKLVPKYMIPSRWRALQALPKNANGKIDRPRLRQMFAEESDSP